MLLLATRSAGKLRELRRMTASCGWQWRGLDEFPEIPEAVEHGRTFIENARIKALYYAQLTSLPALADDSGLEVDALGGAPGVDSAYYAGHPRDDAANNRKLVSELEHVPEAQRTARFRCTMAFAEGGCVLFEAAGAVEGRILLTPRGKNGFGYDPHFFVPSQGCTMAELTTGQKNRISHRAAALGEMIPRLEAWAAPRAR